MALAATSWTGNGEDLDVSAGTVTSTTDDSNYQMNGTQITKNTVTMRVTPSPRSNGFHGGYGITSAAVPDDTDDIDYGFDIYQLGGGDPKFRVKENGSTVETWDWESEDYAEIQITDGTIVYKVYNSAGVQQESHTSSLTFNHTSATYNLSAMQLYSSIQSSFTSMDDIGAPVSTSGLLNPPPYSEVRF